MENLTIEFFIAVQFIINSIILLLLFFSIRSTRKKLEGEIDEKFYDISLNNIKEMLQPVLEEASETSSIFESQIKEKRRIIKKLNNKLDDKIISINLILKRAKQYLQKDGTNKDREKIIEPDFVQNQQEKIFALHKKGKSSQEISKELGIAQGEIDLMIGLKKKLLKMGS